MLNMSPVHESFLISMQAILSLLARVFSVLTKRQLVSGVRIMGSVVSDQPAGDVEPARSSQSSFLHLVPLSKLSDLRGQEAASPLSCRHCVVIQEVFAGCNVM